jgi:hypothetical protein
LVHHFSFRTAAASSEVVARLRAITAPASGLFWNWHHLLTWDGRRPPEFAGQISDQTFRLQYLSPMLGFSARPLIVGRILTTGGETEIRVRLRALGHEFALLALVVFNLLREVRSEGVTAEVPILLTLLMVLFAVWWAVGVRRVRGILARVTLGG